MILRSLLTLLIAGMVSLSGHARPQPEEIVRAQISTLQLDNQSYLALTLRHLEGWHTYWKNPGDSGLATKVSFSGQGQALNLKALEWPAPKRYIEEGDILVFGHSGDKTLFFEIPPSLEGKDLSVRATWLMCADICIPGEANFTGRIQNGRFVSNEPSLYELPRELLRRRLENLPQLTSAPVDLDLVLAKDPSRDEGLVLYATLPDIQPEQLIERMNLLTPFPQSPLDFRRETLFFDSSNTLYLKLPIDWDGRYQTPPQPLPADGTFSTPLNLRFLLANPRSQKIEVIEKEFQSFSLEAGQRLEEFHSLLTPYIPPELQTETKALDDQELSQPTSVPMRPTQPLALLLLFALLGGLILNIMPCVLPVISLKLFSLIQHRQESPRRLLFHNLSYTLGVLVTFWILALVVIILKTAGESVGWGFQLQSPTFVALMAIVIFILALNMFGLFEFRTPGGNKLGNVELREGFSGDFLSGVLATILSTPCSAPFLGTALTFAFLSSAWTIFLILTFVGLGLALPFILTGFFPALISFLPRPGMWMDHFKKFLGLTLILTSLWLIDVYQSLMIGSVEVLKLQTLMALIFFAFYLYCKMTKHLALNAPIWTLIAFLGLTIVQGIQAQKNAPPLNAGESTSSLLQEKQIQGLPWGPWSVEAMESLAKEESLVFMDFTAKWCLTCKVNERLVIDTQRFREMIKTYDIKLLLADWTRRDAYIGDWLKSQGLVGVPAYFIQRPDGTLINLGETISFSSLEREFQSARAANPIQNVPAAP